MPTDPGVSIDEAHAALLQGIVRAQKPTSVLEFGWGGGRSCEAILQALNENGTGSEALYVLVDNWTDWGGKRPEGAYKFGVGFVDYDEGAFVGGCDMSFDLIFSDADHLHAQEWFQRTYEVLLNPGGILCYHDVYLYPNLWESVAMTIGSLSSSSRPIQRRWWRSDTGFRAGKSCGCHGPN